MYGGEPAHIIYVFCRANGSKCVRPSMSMLSTTKPSIQNIQIIIAIPVKHARSYANRSKSSMFCTQRIEMCAQPFGSLKPSIRHHVSHNENPNTFVVRSAKTALAL
eukprot:410653_1